MKKGSKEAKAWGRKMKRLRSKKNTTKKRTVKRTVKRKTVRRKSTMAKRKTTRRKSSGFRTPPAAKKILTGMGIGQALSYAGQSNPGIKALGGYFIGGGAMGAIGAVLPELLSGNLNIGGSIFGASTSGAPTGMVYY